MASVFAVNEDEAWVSAVRAGLNGLSGDTGAADDEPTIGDGSRGVTGGVFRGDGQPVPAVVGSSMQAQYQ